MSDIHIYIYYLKNTPDKSLHYELSSAFAGCAHLHKWEISIFKHNINIRPRQILFVYLNILLTLAPYLYSFIHVYIYILFNICRSHKRRPLQTQHDTTREAQNFLSIEFVAWVMWAGFVCSYVCIYIYSICSNIIRITEFITHRWWTLHLLPFLSEPDLFTQPNYRRPLSHPSSQLPATVHFCWLLDVTSPSFLSQLQISTSHLSNTLPQRFRVSQSLFVRIYILTTISYYIHVCACCIQHLTPHTCWEERW